MKSTKIIIGLIAVMALLITIVGALAETTTTTSFSPSSPVNMLNNESKTFIVTVVSAPEPTPLVLNYEWEVDNSMVQSNSTPTFSFNGANNVGTHVVTVLVTGENYEDKTNAWIVNVQEAQPESKLTISSVKVNGKSNGKLSLSDLNEIKVGVSNEHDDKIKDIVVTVKILDVDGDDLEEGSDEFDLSSGKEDDVTLEFDLSNENLEEEDYVVEVEVEGQDTDGNDFSDLETLTVEVDREKDDIVITKAELEDSQVFCTANSQTTLKVNIKNIGENEQEGAKVTVKNTELELNLQRANIDLDDYSGSDNDYEATFALNLEDAEQGTYTLDVAVYSEDNDLMDSKEVELQIVCDSEVSAEKDKESSGYYADQKLAAELQQKINEYKVMQESQAANQSFRENDSYVLLLGVLVALTFFAVTLSATYLLVVKKK